MTADVWLPIPAEEFEGLPDMFDYRLWDGAPGGGDNGGTGGRDYPADPRDCVFYVVPYMRPAPVTTEPMLAMSGVRVVQTLTAGVDDVLGAVAHLPAGVQLCNARGVQEASTAELALALTLASLRGIPGFVRAQQKGTWQSGFHPALADKSVLIVGYGAIGSAVEDRLVPFECARVARVARSARDTERGPVHPLSALPHLLPQADVVILTTPLTPETKGLVNGAFLAGMKDGALLVNVARGAVVDTEALLAEVESGRISAALDVTDPEPLPPGHPLWSAPGVLISPHVGGPTSAFLPRAKRLVAAQLNRFAAGEPLDNVVLTTGR